MSEDTDTILVPILLVLQADKKPGKTTAQLQLEVLRKVQKHVEKMGRQITKTKNDYGFIDLGTISIFHKVLES